jgi:hypothetical protein
MEDSTGPGIRAGWRVEEGPAGEDIGSVVVSDLTVTLGLNGSLEVMTRAIDRIGL